MARSNLAYKQQAREREAAKPSIQKVASRKRAQELKPGVILVAIALIAGLLGFMVFSMVRLNVVTSQIDELGSELQMAESEEVRLNAQLESQMSLSSIETYAEQNLGLTQMTPSQVTYMSLSSGNAIEIPGQEDNWLSSISTAVKDFFSFL